MTLPDWRGWDFGAGVLREATPDAGRLVLWLPGAVANGVKLWERVGNVPGAAVRAAGGLCATAATAVRAAQRVRGPLGRLWARLRSPAGDRSWVLPNGEPAEQQGERVTDLVLAWAADRDTLLSEEQVRAAWPQAARVQRIGTSLFLVSGVQPPGADSGPLPPPACPKEQAEWLLAAARQAGDRRREASALNDLGVACTGAAEAGRAVALLEEALGIAAEANDRALARDVEANLGLALLWAGEPRRALERLGLARAQARAAADLYAEKTALERLGTAHACLRDSGQALAAYDEALALARVLGDRRHEAELLWQQGVQYAELGRQPEAASRAQAAVDVLTALGHPYAGWFADNLRKYQAGEATLARPDSPSGAPGGGALVVGGWAPQPAAVSGPGLLRMALSAARSMAQFLVTGLQTVSAEAHRRRLRTCAGCEHHTGVRCRVCGCFTNAKAWLAHERCPLGKWPA